MSSVSSISVENVEASYMYKFLHYVDWPIKAFSGVDTPYVVGLINADEVTEELMKICASRAANNRSIIIKRLKAGDAFSGLHILFVGRAERAKQAEILKQAQALPVLLVTETEGALTEGSMINFRMLDDRLRFEVSQETAEKAGLKLNARLLALASEVLQKGPSQ